MAGAGGGDGTKEAALRRGPRALPAMEEALPR